MKNIKLEMTAIFGLVLIIFGVAFGIYAGLWWAFIGGISDVINAIRAPELVSMDLAIGIAKIMFSGIIGSISGFVTVSIGYALLMNS